MEASSRAGVRSPRTTLPGLAPKRIAGRVFPEFLRRAYRMLTMSGGSSQNSQLIRTKSLILLVSAMGFLILSKIV